MRRMLALLVLTVEYGGTSRNIALLVVSGWYLVVGCAGMKGGGSDPKT